jgi:hypothetical protein
MITNLFTVKSLANLYDRIVETEPTTSTVGQVGEIVIVQETGLTFECVQVVNTTYTWTPYVVNDILINLTIPVVEEDYLRIRGKAFDIEEDEIVYPAGATLVAGQMVCYQLKLGTYQGFGVESESLGGRSNNYDKKVEGYPISIVGSIQRFHKIA